MSSTSARLIVATKDAEASFRVIGAGTVVQECSSDPPARVLDLEKKHWVEIVLLDERNNPLPGEHYEITIPGGACVSGSLDSKGRARIEGIDSGTCRVTYPNFDKSAWKKR